jgi:predicted nucleic acid-binding protein
LNDRTTSRRKKGICSDVRNIYAGHGYLQLYHQKSAGTPIGNMDMMIAAAALAIGATLVTNNERHFSRIEGLDAANWIEQA